MFIESTHRKRSGLFTVVFSVWSSPEIFEHKIHLHSNLFQNSLPEKILVQAWFLMFTHAYHVVAVTSVTRFVTENIRPDLKCMVYGFTLS